MVLLTLVEIGKVFISLPAAPWIFCSWCWSYNPPLNGAHYVNRHFRAIAERLLYSKIQRSWKNHKNPPSIVPLLRTIISRSELAAHVTHIQLEGQYLSNLDLRHRSIQFQSLALR